MSNKSIYTVIGISLVIGVLGYFGFMYFIRHFPFN